MGIGLAAALVVLVVVAVLLLVAGWQYGRSGRN